MRRNVLALFTVLAFLSLSRAAFGLTIAEYLARIESSIEKVDDMLDAKDGARPNEVEELRSLTEELSSPKVSLANGQEVAVDNRWVVREVNKIENLESVEQKESLRKLKKRLEALAKQTRACTSDAPRHGPPQGGAATRPGNENDVDSKKLLNEILSQEEYSTPVVSQELVSFADKISNKINNLVDRIINWFYKLKRWELPKWLKDFLQWLGRIIGAPLRWLGGLTGIPFAASIWAWIFWSGILGVLVILAFLLVRKGLRNVSIERIERTSAEDSEEAIIEKPPTDILSGAQELAREGNFRQAIRLLYLATLVHLHRNRLIVYDKTKTNWEYLNAVKENSELYDKLTPLTSIFDLKWYGKEECRPQDFDYCHGLVLEIVETGKA